MQNLPTKLYTAQQSRELDRIAITEYGIAGISLMQKAADAVWKEISERWATISTLCIFCGAGNNAGDGYWVGTLALQAGLKVKVYSLTELDKLSGDALAACKIYQKSGGNSSCSRVRTDEGSLSRLLRRAMRAMPDDLASAVSQ